MRSQQWAAKAGINLTIEDWSVDWFDLNFTANNLKVFAPLPKTPVLEAPKVSLKFSLFRFFSNWKTAINELYIYSPKLNLYKPVTGKWNLNQVFNEESLIELANTSLSSSQSKNQDIAQVYFKQIVVEDLTVNWRQELAGSQTGGDGFDSNHGSGQPVKRHHHR